MAKTLTIRLTEADADLVEWAKRETLRGTASQALLEAARRYRKQFDRERDLAKARAARAARMAERAGQVRSQADALARIAEAMDRDVREWGVADVLGESDGL